jgi:peptide/nickel transport system substrate-binding protein
MCAVRRAAVLLSVVLLLGGCSPVPTGNAGARNSGTRPGVLRIGSISDPDTLSPLVGNYQIDSDLAMFWGGFLFNYDDHNTLLPELATVEPTLANGGISPDGRTITYHLRSGVKWQDGVAFTADDVIFTWHAVMNPQNNVPSRVGYEHIKRIDKTGPMTVVVHLDAPYAPFVATFLTQGANPYPVYPKHLLDKYPDLNRVAYNSAPIGTGPFRVAEWHRGQTIRMVANPNYWRGRPKLDEVQYRAIPEENTDLTSIETHEIDLWFNASAALYPQAHAIAGTHVVLTPYDWFTLVGFNSQRPNVSDVRVRRALAYAMDRAKWIDAIGFGVQLPGDGDQPSATWAHNAAIKPYPHDPVQARALLDAAGWRVGPNGIRVRNGVPLQIVIVSTTGNAVGNRLAVVMQSAWHDIGVDTVVKTYASGIMFASYGAGGILQRGNFDVDFFSWLSGVDPDDSTLIMCDQFPPAGQNNFRFCNHEVDRQERIALSTFDRSKRKRAYDRIQEITQDQVPFVTMWFYRLFDVVSDDLKNYRPARAVTPFWNTWEYSI